MVLQSARKGRSSLTLNTRRSESVSEQFLAHHPAVLCFLCVCSQFPRGGLSIKLKIQPKRYLWMRCNVVQKFRLLVPICSHQPGLAHCCHNRRLLQL
jgi:hypothetical protein